jgi:hypothetical protein
MTPEPAGASTSDMFLASRSKTDSGNKRNISIARSTSSSRADGTVASRSERAICGHATSINSGTQAPAITNDHERPRRARATGASADPIAHAPM